MLEEAGVEDVKELTSIQHECIANELFCFLLLTIQHPLGLCPPHRSPLIYFLAIMGIDAKAGRFRDPLHYTYVLGGVLYISRALVLEGVLSVTGWPHLSLPAHGQIESREEAGHSPIEARERAEDAAGLDMLGPGEDGYMAAFQKQRRTWLVQGKNTPVAAILRHLAYGKCINMETGAAASVTWNEDLTILYYKEHPIVIDSFKTGVQKIVQEAALLMDRLMLGMPVTIELSTVRDTISQEGHWRRDGCSFYTHPENHMAWGFEALLKAAYREQGSQRLLKEEMAQDSDGVLASCVAWKKGQCIEYLGREKEFLELLLVGIHFTAGQPARGPEIGSLKHVNRQTVARNIYVLDGRVAIITDYDKARKRRGQEHYVVRYLPQQVGVLLVKYLVWVRPFARNMPGSKVASDYLWIHNRNPFNDDYVSRVFKKIVLQHMGLTIRLSDYRQIAVALAREFLRSHLAVLGIKQELESSQPYGASDNEAEETGTSHPDDIFDLQAAHSSRTALLNYALDRRFLTRLNASLLRQYLHASIAWHRWLGMDNPAARAGGKRKQSESMDLTGSASKRADWPLELPIRWESAAGHGKRRISILEALWQMYGAEAKFQSPAQAHCMQAVMESNRNGAIVVLGTGQGKSLLFYLLAKQACMETVIVVVPFVALIDNLMQRAAAHSIETGQWNPQDDVRPVALLFVSADQVAAPAFIEYAGRLVAQGQLRHIFLDECHVALTDTRYRENLRFLNNLRLLNAPLTCLTATLPPELVPKLRQQMLLPKAKLTRFSTAQAGIQYRVVDCGRQALLPAVKQHAQRTKLRKDSGERGIIFARSIQAGTELAKQLKCCFYYSESPDKAQVLQAWTAAAGQWLVATGALGTGMDIPGVSQVVHMDRPYGMISYLQQAGRGGRHGHATLATLYINTASMEPRETVQLLSLHSVERVDEEALSNYMTASACRRISIARYMDGPSVGNEASRDCQGLNMLLCDICHRRIADMAGEDQLLGGANSTYGQEEREPEEEEIGNTASLHAEKHMQVAERKAFRQAGLRFFKQYCAYCYIESRQHVMEEHVYQQCKKTSKCKSSTWADYRQWRKNLRFTHYQACFDCGLDQLECGRDISSKEACAHKDIVFIVVFLLSQESWFMQQTCENEGAYFGGTTEKDYCNWLTSAAFEVEESSWIIVLFTRYVGEHILD